MEDGWFQQYKPKQFSDSFTREVYKPRHLIRTFPLQIFMVSGWILSLPIIKNSRRPKNFKLFPKFTINSMSINHKKPLCHDSFYSVLDILRTSRFEPRESFFLLNSNIFWDCSLRLNSCPFTCPASTWPGFSDTFCRRFFDFSLSRHWMMMGWTVWPWSLNVHAITNKHGKRVSFSSLPLFFVCFSSTYLLWKLIRLTVIRSQRLYCWQDKLKSRFTVIRKIV